MADRRVGDWRNGVDLDAEIAAWSRSTLRAKKIFGAGIVVAIVLLAAFAAIGNSDGVFYMAGAAFFMAAITATLMLFDRQTS